MGIFFSRCTDRKKVVFVYHGIPEYWFTTASYHVASGLEVLADDYDSKISILDNLPDSDTAEVHERLLALSKSIARCIVSIVITGIRDNTHYWPTATRWVQFFCAQSFVRTSILNIAFKLWRLDLCGHHGDTSRLRAWFEVENLTSIVLYELGIDTPDRWPAEASDLSWLFQTMAQNINEKEQGIRNELQRFAENSTELDSDDKLDLIDAFLQGMKEWLQRKVQQKERHSDDVTGVLFWAERVILRVAENRPLAPISPEPPTFLQRLKGSFCGRLQKLIQLTKRRNDTVEQEGDTEETVSVETVSQLTFLQRMEERFQKLFQLTKTRSEPADGHESPGNESTSGKMTEIWKMADYKALVMWMVIDLGKGNVQPLTRRNPEIIPMLTQKLVTAMAGRDVPVRPEICHMKKIIEATMKDLIEQLGSQQVLQVKLQADDDNFHNIIVDILKRHLVAPRSAFRRIKVEFRRRRAVVVPMI
ncbi:uncharacterized protein V6R79_015998 [Siganus canaliculatus]